jgi:hypothetical protein
MKTKMTLTEAAAVINKASENWIFEKGKKESIFSLTIRKSRKLSKDPVFNLAAWLMYNFGPCLEGESESDWVDTAKQIIKIVKS